MGDLIEYNAVSNAVNAVDRYDADNFYPFEGDDDEGYNDFNGLDAEDEGLDIEFSNGEGSFGQKFKSVFTKKSSTTPSTEQPTTESDTKDSRFSVKTAIQNRQAGLGERLEQRQKGLEGRIGRREMRIEARDTRRKTRQMATWNQQSAETKQQAQTIGEKSAEQGNTIPRKSLENLKIGNATDEQERIAVGLLGQAVEDIQAGRQGKENASVLKDDGSVADTWWKKQSKGVKVAIIGGGLFAVGLTIFAIVKLRGK